MTAYNDRLHHSLHVSRLHQLRTLHYSHAADFGHHLHFNLVWLGNFILWMEIFFWLFFLFSSQCTYSISCVCICASDTTSLTCSTLISYYCINHHHFTFELIYFFLRVFILENVILKMRRLFSLCQYSFRKPISYLSNKKNYPNLLKIQWILKKKMFSFFGCLYLCTN